MTDGFNNTQQPKPISGYRQLTEAEIDMINAVKAHAEEIGKVIEILQATENVDQRWISIGKTHLQQGFMAVTRGIAQPTAF